MNELNHECAICGQKYHYCADCGNISSFTPWRRIVDTIDHYKVFIIIRDYENGYIKKDEANKLLKQINLSNIQIFIPEIRAKIEEILIITKEKNE